VNEAEARLIVKAKKGDVSAFEALMNQHAIFAYNLALRTLNNSQEAEDVAQEAFVRAWRAMPNFRADAQFSTWLYRIVTNLCYNRLPKLKTDLQAMDVDEDVVLADNRPSVESGMMDEEMKIVLHSAVNQLPEGYRLMISLRHVQGLSYNEIAEVTDMPIGTVKTGIFRARKQLKAILLERGVQR
jgi:RNA polymerase sigma-70 factor (ECF subfamily)